MSKISVKKLAGGAAWALLGKVLAAALGLIISGLVARLLSPEAVGIYFLLVTVVGFGMLIGALGLSQVAIRYLANFRGLQDADGMSKVLGKVLILSTFGAVAIILLYAFFLNHLVAYITGIEELRWLALPVAIWIGLSATHRIVAESFRGLGNIKFASLFSGMTTGGVISGLILASLLVVALAIPGTTLTYVVDVSALSMLSSLIIGSVLLIRLALSIATKLTSSQQHPPAASEPLAINLEEGVPSSTAPLVEPTFSVLLFSGLPLLVTNLINFLLTQGDIWILATVRDPSEVALYGAAARMVFMVTLPLMVVNAVMPPLIAEFHVKGQLKQIEPVIRGVASLAAIPASMVLVIFVIAGKPLLGLVFGDFYVGGATILLILVAGQMINVLSGSCAIALAMTGHQRVLMIITVVTGGLLITLGIYAASIWGGLGLALVVAISTVVRNLTMVAAAKRLLGIWTWAGFDIKPATQAVRQRLARRRNP